MVHFISHIIHELKIYKTLSFPKMVTAEQLSL